ncbi:hypothetical protein RRF57_001634 [Xylaria bambusicola]|uniref:protein S-acyltransferase n=1 Tax=Xylaria bambusicola TaxID=326684 RepID=A0AAN7UCA8_9PEZI
MDLTHHNLQCVTSLPATPDCFKPKDPLNKFAGFQPIHWAVVGGHTETVRALLDKGANFHARTYQGWSSIHLAAMFGRFETMKWLIDYAIDKHGSSYEDESLLDDKSSTLLENPLHLAVTHVSQVSEDEIPAFMEIFENLRGSVFWTSRNFARETPLHRLAASGPTRFPINGYMIEISCHTNANLIV